MSDPSIGALRALDLIERRGSVAAAAEGLRLTPSAVTHKIRAAEARLGVRLTERGARPDPFRGGVAPAVAARPALEALERAAMERWSGPGARTVAAQPGLAAAWLAPRLAAPPRRTGSN